MSRITSAVPLRGGGIMGGVTVIGGGLGGSSKPPAAQANPAVWTTPGVHVYGVPRGTEYLIVEVAGGSSRGHSNNSFTPSGGATGGAGGGGAKVKLAHPWTATAKVWTVTVGVGNGSAGNPPAGTSKVSVGSVLIEATGASDLDTPGVGNVTVTVGASDPHEYTGDLGDAGAGSVGGAGGETGGGLFASAGGLGGADGLAGKDGTSCIGGGGAGEWHSGAALLGGAGAPGAVRITAFGANGKIV